MVKTKKTLLTVLLSFVAIFCFALGLSATPKGVKADPVLVNIDDLSGVGLSYAAVSVDATTGGKLGGGLQISTTLMNKDIPFSIDAFKTLSVQADPYFASALDYDYSTQIAPFFTIVVDSTYLTYGDGYNTLHIYIKGSDGTSVDAFHLGLRKNGATVPPYFLKDYNFPLDDTYAEQYVVRVFVDYANGKLYYLTGLEMGAGTGRALNDYCTVIDYDFAGSGKFSSGTGSINLIVESGMTGSYTSATVNAWIKDICGEQNFGATIAYASALTGEYGDELAIPDATISYLGTPISATKSATAPNGDPVSAGDTLDQVGNYTVRYSITEGNKTYYKDAILPIVEPVLRNTDDAAVYETVSIDQTTGSLLGNGYNVSDKAYTFPFSITALKSLTVPTMRLKSLINAEGLDTNELPDLTPFATIVLGGFGFTSQYTGIDIKLSSDLSGGATVGSLVIRKAAGGINNQAILWEGSYLVDDTYGEQKVIRLYADYTNGKMCLATGLAINSDGRASAYLYTFDFDFTSSGMFEGTTGFITVQCYDYWNDCQASNCTAYVKNICGVESGLNPAITVASAVSGTFGSALDLPAGTASFLGNNESATLSVYDPAGVKIANNAVLDEFGVYTVRYSIKKGVNVFYKDYEIDTLDGYMPEMVNGAYIRLAVNYGLRFVVTADLDDIAALEDAASSVSYGVRITSASKAGHLDIAGNIYEDDAGVRTFYFALTGFDDETINYSFTCTAYVEIDGVRHYLDASVTRSITGVAVAARSNEEDALNGFTKEFTDSRSETFWYDGDLSDESCQLISDIANKYE